MKTLFAKTFFGTTVGVRAWHHLAETLTNDREAATVGLVRGFSPNADFLEKFRVQPSPCLLDFMLKRFLSFNQTVFDHKTMELRKAQKKLENAGVFIPGKDADISSVWPFPMVLHNRDLFI